MNSNEDQQGSAIPRGLIIFFAFICMVAAFAMGHDLGFEKGRQAGRVHEKPAPEGYSKKKSALKHIWDVAT